MPVDKFGHTDGTTVQRVISGGVTLSQVSEAFLRRDGVNVATGNLNMNKNSIVELHDPALSQDAATKNYVDSQIFATRTYVDDQATITRSHAATKNYVDEQVVTTRNFVDEKVVATRTYIDEQVLAARDYVERISKISRVGFIPNMEANESSTGFIASASSTAGGQNQAYAAFNYREAWVSSESDSAWLQIKCPRPVRIWRIMLTIKCMIAVLSASDDGIEFTTITITPAGDDKYITTPTRLFRYYRVTVLNWLGSTTVLGFGRFQIYEYLD